MQYLQRMLSIFATTIAISLLIDIIMKEFSSQSNLEIPYCQQLIKKKTNLPMANNTDDFSFDGILDCTTTIQIFERYPTKPKKNRIIETINLNKSGFCLKLHSTQERIQSIILEGEIQKFNCGPSSFLPPLIRSKISRKMEYFPIL